VVNGLAAIGTIAITVLFIPLLGILGAVLALVGYAAMFLALLTYYSRKIRHAPFSDASALGGFLATVAVVSWVHFTSPSLELRLGLLAMVVAGGMTICIGIVRASGFLGASRYGRN
jgi:O-antigen/teichoic acid export membrane protein